MKHTPLAIVVALACACAPAVAENDEQDETDPGPASDSCTAGDTEYDPSGAGVTPHDGGCPPDQDACVVVTQSDVAMNLDEDRFADGFCEDRCPPPPTEDYILEDCEPRAPIDDGASSEPLEIDCHYWSGCM